MILTCPNCSSQFKVSIEALGNEGRKVRCSACGETWFEDSHVKSIDSEDDSSDIFEVDIDIDDLEQDLDQESDEGNKDGFVEIDIPDAVKPNEEDRDISVPNKKKANDNAKDSNNAGKKTSYVVAVVIFITIFAYLMLSSSSMMRSYPSMQEFYGVFGIKMEIPSADKITFANLQANEHEGVIKVSGDIINLTDEMQALKMLEISLGDGSNEHEIKWYATPPKAVLDAEESVKFSSEYKLEKNDKISHGATKDDHEGDKSEEEQYIRVRFVLKPALSTSNISSKSEHDSKSGSGHKSKPDHDSKTGAKGGGNNQAHHGGGSGH